MSTKMMIVVGSPRRNGNCATMAGWLSDVAKARGCEVELVDAANLDYVVNGCIACMGCKGSSEYRCVIGDEAAAVLARMPEQDIIVFASPVYFMGLSAQIKQLIDRMYSLFKLDPETGRFDTALGDVSFGLLAVAGGDLGSGLKLVDENVHAITSFMGKSLVSCLVPSAPQDPDDILADAELREKTEAFAGELLGAS